MSLSPSIQAIHDKHVEKKLKDLMFEAALLEDTQHTFGFDEPETVEIYDYPLKAEDLNKMSLEDKEEYLLSIAKGIDSYIEGSLDMYDESYFDDSLYEGWMNSDVDWKELLGTCNIISDEAEFQLLSKLQKANIELDHSIKEEIGGEAVVKITNSTYWSGGEFVRLDFFNEEEDESEIPDEILTKLTPLSEQDYEFVAKNVQNGSIPDYDDFRKNYHYNSISYPVGIVAWFIIDATKLINIINKATEGVEADPYPEKPKPFSSSPESSEEEMKDPFSGDPMFQEAKRYLKNDPLFQE